MSDYNQPIIAQLTRAVAIVVAGGSALLAINFAIHPNTKPYYAMIADERAHQRIDTHIQQEKTANDSNSRNGSK